ncbi:segmentation protein cap'n'collar isoform X2 [Hylaeus anthracinus]|uniref:segmentation protein cap'n'collar isoform X2 n=1 Tax=Hylaeus volcanicus TaxID=313075 RepID=UPI0023B7F618|nr:segmentation protein cap'n'collar isoform X2 [Hylaeus volcanicus]XP_054003821.1 segmentation protein cap'n'collar isoform X2 [Hylaeus anthracinus]
MVCIKKMYREELLQLALLLSLLRVDPESYLGLDIQTIGVGSLDLNNGSGWHNDAHTIIHRPTFVHPKNLDSILLNYERDLFEDLNSLGRYNTLNSGLNNIHAYLLNIEDSTGDTAIAGPSIPTDPDRNPDPPNSSQSPNEPANTAELTQEDMDLIEVLWKQDVDLGFTLVEPSATVKKPCTSEKGSEDDIEKLKALEAINATDEKKNAKEFDVQEEDPWAGLPYTVDLETGEYILNSGSQGGSGCNSPEVDDQLLREASLDLDNPLAGLTDDSLGLTNTLELENDFSSDLLGGSLLGSASVEGFLNNNTLGLPDGFNLEEALQLVGLDEVQTEETKPEVKKKKEDEESTSAKDETAIITSSNVEVEKSSRCEDPETGDMIHTPQFHHPHHPHHRSFQGRMPFVRAMSMEQRWQDLASLLSLPGAPDHFAHPAHPGYPGHGISHSHYEAQRNVLLHNATLAPPVGDLNATSPYHNVAVATSMNLTNSSEPIGTESGAAYKSEPTDMMYYHTPTSDSINQTTDGFLSSLLNDEDLHLMDMAMNDGIYTMRMLDNGSNNASGPTGATALSGVQTTGGTASSATGLTTLPVVTDERMDASSDSAVSSMGSERVPSLSDGEWMETGSNSSHTQADSHYTMDYASKYRMSYDCSYSVSGRNGGSPRCQTERTMPPVAQKKHQMFAKRYFQEQGTGSPLGATAHPTTPIKYEYDSHTIGAGAPGNAYSGPIEGAAGPQPEMKYTCSVDFTRHQSGRSAIEHVHHNHTYHLPAESSGSLQRPISRDKKVRKSESDEHLTRDEKRARALNVPIPVNDIINLPMDEFNERLSKYDLSEAQLSLIRDIRRRGKNKVAAQNCRKRKLDQIISLADEVKEMRDRKMRLIREHEFMLLERQRVKDKFSQLYRHVFQSLRDPDGNQYHPYEYSLQQSADGNVLLVPRNQTNSHHPRSTTMEPKTKSNPEHKE